MAVPGGWSKTLEANGDIQEKCDKLRPEIEARMNKKFEVFRAVQYRHQLVSGTNYLVKVYVGKDDFLHVMMFEALPCHGGELKLTGVRERKGQDPLVPFHCGLQHDAEVDHALSE